MNAFVDQTWNESHRRDAEVLPGSAKKEIPIDDVTVSTFRRKMPLNWYTIGVYPLLSFFRDPESANQLAKLVLDALPHAFRDKTPDAPSLAISVFGKTFSNPIGMAAGWDKDADKYSGLFDRGFGFVEVGTITPRAQPGNDRTRVFRLPEDSAVINRMGFPSQGMPYALTALATKPKRGILGINVGANKDSADRLSDYALGAKALAPYADYLVCNVSSPNTPGLRMLQSKQHLSDLIHRVQDALTDVRPPILVKIAPDATEADLDDIVQACRECKVDGLIVGNTTVKRPVQLRSKRKAESGGLSGAPLTDLSTKVLRLAARRAERQFPLIGCGGVFDGDDAYAKIKAGASLIQLYTALIYGGPPLVRNIKTRLAELLARDGHSSVAQAVGTDL